MTRVHQVRRSFDRCAMRRLLLSGLALVLLAGGCDALRLAPSERQKQNAWLHNRTAAAASQVAQAEGGSQELQSLTRLSELQSQSFTAYCGLPREYPPAQTTGEILAQSNWQLASDSLTDSAQRPDPWQVADSLLELGLGLGGLLGGVYGARIVRFLREARAKSQALKEIIQGNELFKQSHPEQTDAFKTAQQRQSPETRQLVTAIKAS